MRTLRRYFLGRLLREKLMLVAFVGLAVAMWLSAFAGRANRAALAHRALSADLAEQKQWLANQQAIEAAALTAVQNLDPAKTLDETRLVGALSALGQEQNLRYTIDTPQTARSGQFAMHTVQITLSRSDWEALKRFYLALSRRSPYISIEQFALSADRGNPAQLSAQARVSSVEIVR